ncbi:MAG: nickel-type superoxide dismutase maturation protease [Actinomycetota bacterium]
MTDRDRPQAGLVRETLAWAFGRRKRVRVVGDSMLPTLRPGQFVLVNAELRPAPGDLVLARHPDRDELLVVKRLASITTEGSYELASDNPAAGTDSRTWGPLPADLIEGTITRLLD